MRIKLTVPSPEYNWDKTCRFDWTYFQYSHSKALFQSFNISMIVGTYCDIGSTDVITFNNKFRKQWSIHFNSVLHSRWQIYMLILSHLPYSTWWDWKWDLSNVLSFLWLFAFSSFLTLCGKFSHNTKLQVNILVLRE